MSKFILVCSRASAIPNFRSKVQTLFQRLLPSDIQPRPANITIAGNLHWAILNPSASLKYHEDSVCIGKMFHLSQDWWKPGAPTPDGNFAISRNSDTTLEIITDLLGTRTIWYYFDEQQFIVSTTQRSIIHFLGSYEPNPEVYSWFLSSGTQGPELSWDKRIKYLPGNSRLSLDKKTWNLQIETEPITFHSTEYTEENLELVYESILEDALSKININPQNWVMLLSGGYDSRGLCHYLPGSHVMKNITWGKIKSRYTKNTDTYIAAKIAKKLNLDFQFFPIKNAASQFDEMIERFLINGECRIDKISGYMDLFATWKKLFDAGVEGIIRGDHTFDYRSSDSPFEARYIYNLLTLDDYKGLEFLQPFGLKKQIIPDKFKQLPHESLTNWGGRLDRMFYFPIIQTALADLKLGYVENINPYLNRSLVLALGGLPEKAHLDKNILKKIVKKIYPDIPFATRQGLTTEANFITQPKVIKYIHHKLNEPDVSGIFPREMKQIISEEIYKELKKSYKLKLLTSIRKILKYHIPVKLKKTIKKPIEQLKPEFPLMGFRIVLMERMHQILTEDAAIFKKNLTDQLYHESKI